MAMHLSDRMFETHLSTPISQTFALIAGDCNTTEFTVNHHISDRRLIRRISHCRSDALGLLGRISESAARSARDA
jgi:hypothetical protein